MSFKWFAVFAAVCAALLGTQTASCDDVDAQPPNELYILNPGTVFPVIVTDPSSPLLSMDSDVNKLVCDPNICEKLCKSLGFAHGRCNSKNYCVCSK